MTPLRIIKENIQYELIREVASGGMGVVYEAMQVGIEGFRKRVALKVIRTEYSKVPAFRANFVGEARLVSDLIHTNIVQTYHLGKDGDQYYIVMEFVTGFTLEEFLKAHKTADRRVPTDIAAFIVSRVCRALSYAHTKKDEIGRRLGIVHRDINPRNILLAMEGDVKITDFGIAKAFDLMYNDEGKVVVGKDEYLSPEQSRREVTDQRADIFSCGIVLAELLLGRNIFDGGDAVRTRQNIQCMEVPDLGALRSDVDPRLNAVVQRALTRNRRDRYQTAQEMLSALEVYLYSDGYGVTNEKLAVYMQEVSAMRQAQR